MPIPIEKHPEDIKREFTYPPQPPKHGEITENALPEEPPIKLLVPIQSNETIRHLETDPPGSQIDYGGKAAFCGAVCWYIHTRGDGIAARYIAVPCLLYERFARGHEKWNLSVLWHPGGSFKKLIGIEFSQKPEHGKWTWPIIPIVGARPGSFDITEFVERLNAQEKQIDGLSDTVSQLAEKITALESAITAPVG